MAITFRLQDLVSVADLSANQDKQDAVDVQAYKSLVFQVRVPVTSTATSATLTIQHAATLDDDAFVNSSTTFDVQPAGTTVTAASNFLRYIRWSLVSTGTMTTPPQFMIDVVARES